MMMMIIMIKIIYVFIHLFQLSPETRHTALVVSPLKSLMSDQVTYLNGHGIPSTSIVSMDELDPSDLQGIVNYL